MFSLNPFKKKSILPAQRTVDDLIAEANKSPVFAAAFAKELLQLQMKAQELKAKELAPDGKGEFIGEGTHEEYEDLQKEESGMKPWYDIFGKSHD